MMKQLRAALVSLAILTLLTGVVYPLVVTGVAQAAFPKQANGSLIVKDGKVVGSSLIGRSFDDPKYFSGRPSACKYDGAASSGSNVAQSTQHLPAGVPVDLATASGSGLDPHISPEAAEYQVRRVATARNLNEARVRALIAEHTEGRSLGFLGEPRVNVLVLNLALDDLRSMSSWTNAAPTPTSSSSASARKRRSPSAAS